MPKNLHIFQKCCNFAAFLEQITQMTYTRFYNQWHSLGCFSIHQVHAIIPTFNRSNLHQWQRAGYIVPLRQGWYAFADYVQQPDYARYVAGKICAPSYISLHTALSFYGIIPEAVVEITSVTTQKTCRYENAFGQFSYQTIRPRLFWGFEPKTMRDAKQYMMATPEKALVDTILFTSKVPNSLVGLQQFLEEDMRFEMDALHSMDISLLQAIAEVAPKQTIIQNLITLCQR